MKQKKNQNILKSIAINIISNHAFNNTRNDLYRHIASIYREHPRKAVLYGSGFFLNIADKYFLITAAHVLDEISNYTILIAGSKSQYLQTLEGIIWTSKSPTGNRNDDQIDIGIVELSHSFAKSLGLDIFINLSRADLEDTGKNNSVYIATGYPANRNKHITRKGNPVTRQAFCYTSDLLPTTNLGDLNLHRGSHLLIGFNKRHSRDLTGKDVTAPNLEGMSGGPVWRMSMKSATNSLTKLVGMTIEIAIKKRGILLVRLPLITETIRQQYPHLDQYIPKAKSIEVTSKLITHD